MAVRRRANTSRVLLVVLVALAFVAVRTSGQRVVLPKAGDHVRVTLNDGTRLEGEFVRESIDFVVIRIDGVEAPIDGSKVVDISVVGDLFEQYVELRKQIRDNDVDRLLALVRWLTQRQMYDEAIAELDDIQKQEPFNADARALRKTVSQLKLLRDRRRARPGEDAEPQRESVDEPRRLPPGAFGLLTKEQINLIKVYEVDLDDPPHVIVRRETVDRLLQRYAEHPLVPVTREGRQAFLRKPAIDVLSVMFQIGARDLYGEVEVIGQPTSMRLFRDHVHAGWLVNRCGTTQCHGGADAGQLMLTNRRSRSDEAVYTNFLILDRFRTSLGAPMISYEAPERSALMQMGLPRADALYPHPPVKGWRPVFRSRQDPGYRRAVAWIKSMYRPHPDYPITYTPPGQREADPAALDGPLRREETEPAHPAGER